MRKKSLAKAFIIFYLGILAIILIGSFTLQTIFKLLSFNIINEQTFEMSNNIIFAALFLGLFFLLIMGKRK